MKVSPYDTTACKDYVTDQIGMEIERAEIASNPPVTRLTENPFTGKELEGTVGLVGPQHDAVPAFAHPYIQPVNNDGKNVLRAGSSVYIDVRNFTRLNRQNEMTVSSNLDYKLATIRGVLTAYWNREGGEDFFALGGFQTVVFSRWLTEVITRRLALELDTQMRVSVIAAWFYLCQFHEEEQLDDRLRVNFVKYISQNMRVSSENVTAITESLKYIPDSTAFISALIEVGDSARLETMNLGLLYSLVGGSWFGANAREIVAVALEHPPTFISMIAIALDERGYRRTVIGRTVENCSRKGDDKNFLYNLRRLPL